MLVLTIVRLLKIQNAFQAKLVPFISDEEQKFIENNVLNNPLTLTWNHILRTSLDKKKLMYNDNKFFWLDKTSWDYTNFADWGIQNCFTQILAAQKAYFLFCLKINEVLLFYLKTRVHMGRVHFVVRGQQIKTPVTMGVRGGTRGGVHS